MFRQHPNVYHTCLNFTLSLQSMFTTQIQTEPHLRSTSNYYTITTALFQLRHHLPSPCPASTQSLLPIDCQNTTPACPLPVRIPHLLPISSQYIIPPALGKSEYHIFAHFQSEYNLLYICPIRIPHFLTMYGQNITYLAQDIIPPTHAHSK